MVLEYLIVMLCVRRRTELDLRSEGHQSCQRWPTGARIALGPLILAVPTTVLLWISRQGLVRRGARPAEFFRDRSREIAPPRVSSSSGLGCTVSNHDLEQLKRPACGTLALLRARVRRSSVALEYVASRPQSRHCCWPRWGHCSPENHRVRGHRDGLATVSASQSGSELPTAPSGST